MNLIVDGFGLVYSSHYAFNTLSTSNGLLSGSVYGFLKSMKTIKSKFPYCHITIAWDLEPTRKKEAFRAYKSNRSSINLPEQINDLKKIFLNLNVSQTEYEGEEADDVIASLVQKYKNDQVYIYSSDKDMLQLVEDGSVIVVHPKRGKNQEEYYDEEKVKKKYGVSSKNFSCFQSFRGDNIDSVPGVPRIKSSLIAYLSEKYKNLSCIYENLDKEKLTPYQRKSLIEHKEQVYLNNQLVKLRLDLPLIIKKGNPDYKALIPYFNKYEIVSINPQTYVSIFIDVSSFGVRKSPKFEYKNYSLFDEE